MDDGPIDLECSRCGCPQSVVVERRSRVLRISNERAERVTEIRECAHCAHRFRTSHLEHDR